MNARFTPPDEQPDAAAERAARRLAMLAELAETGMEISRRIRVEVRALDQVETVEDLKIAPTSADLSLAFSRVSRAVRQVLAMETRLEADAAKAASPPDPDEARHRGYARAGEELRAWLAADTARRRAVRRERSARAGSAAMGLDDEDLDEADDLDDLDGMMGASDAEVMARVCADLGVEREVSMFGGQAEGDALSVPPRVRGGGAERSEATEGQVSARPLLAPPGASRLSAPHAGRIHKDPARPASAFATLAGQDLKAGGP
jgi:hypothetical protein